jgi:ferritin-like protein
LRAAVTAEHEERESSMAGGQLHESPEDLSPETRELHRALVSLIEELEAVDWYGQRVDAANDEELVRVLAHNRDEEKEHACMTLEWIRRHDPVFDRYLRQFLFQPGSIVDGEPGSNGAKPTLGADATLGIGSLRKEEEEPT